MLLLLILLLLLLKPQFLLSAALGWFLLLRRDFLLGKQGRGYSRPLATTSFPPSPGTLPDSLYTVAVAAVVAVVRDCSVTFFPGHTFAM